MRGFEIAMRWVSAEVRKDALGTCERGLRIDDPVATAKLVAELRNGSVVAEFSDFEDAAETFEELASEHLGQSSHGEEKTRVAGREKDLLIRGQRTARDDAVQMRMEREVLRPGVEDRRDAERAAGVSRRLTREVARIASEGGERLRGRAEEEIVDDSRSVDRERTEFVGQGEDDVEVLDRK